MISKNNISNIKSFPLSAEVLKNTFSKVTALQFVSYSIALASFVIPILFHIFNRIMNRNTPPPLPPRDEPRNVTVVTTPSSNQAMLAQIMRGSVPSSSSLPASGPASNAPKANGTPASSSTSNPSEPQVSAPGISAALGKEVAEKARNVRTRPALPPKPPAFQTRESDNHPDSRNGTAHINQGPAAMPASMEQIADTVADNLISVVTSFTPSDPSSSPAQIFRISVGSLNRAASNLSELPKRASLREHTANLIKDGSIKGQNFDQFIKDWRVKNRKTRAKITEAETFKSPAANQSPAAAPDSPVTENENLGTSVVNPGNFNVEAMVDKFAENNRKMTEFSNRFIASMHTANPEEIIRALPDKFNEFIIGFSDGKNAPRLISIVISLLLNQESIENKKSVLEFVKVVLKYSKDNDVDADLANKVCFELANKLATECADGRSLEHKHRAYLLNPVTFHRWYTLALYFIELNEYISDSWPLDKAEQYAENLLALLSFLSDPQFHIDLSLTNEKLSELSPAGKLLSGNLVEQHVEIFNKLFDLVVAKLGLPTENGALVFNGQKFETIRDYETFLKYIVKDIKKTNGKSEKTE